MNNNTHWLLKAPIYFLGFCLSIFIISQFLPKEADQKPNFNAENEIVEELNFSQSESITSTHSVLNEPFLEAIYNRSDFSDRGIDFQKFKSDIASNQYLRQAIFDKNNFRDRGMTLRDFENLVFSTKEMDTNKWFNSEVGLGPRNDNTVETEVIPVDNQRLILLYYQLLGSNSDVSLERFKERIQTREYRIKLYKDLNLSSQGYTMSSFEVALASTPLNVKGIDFEETTEVSDNRYVVNVGGEWRGRAGGFVRGGKWGIIDKDGNIILPIIYDYIDHMSGQSHLFYFLGEESDRDYQLCGIVSRKGMKVTEPIYEGREDYFISNGHVWLKKGGFWGMINLEGDTVYDFKYSVYEDKWNAPYISEGYVNLGQVLIDVNNSKEFAFGNYIIRSSVRCGTVILENIESKRQAIYNVSEQKVVFDSQALNPFGECLYTFSNVGNGAFCQNFVEGQEYGIVNDNGTVIVKPNSFNALTYDYDRNIIVAYNDYERHCGNGGECFCSFEGNETVIAIDGTIISQ